MNEKICVIGLGYVGLPLACALANHFDVVGYDIDGERVNELIDGFDKTKEITDIEKLNRVRLYTTSTKEIADCTVYIVCFPTPVNINNLPDLSPLAAASMLVGSVIKGGDLVVFESTTYPGCTVEYCGGLIDNEMLNHTGRIVRYHLGYSPERINPGDREHTIDKVVKLVSGDTTESRDRVAAIYSKIAPIHKCASIEIAEAAKIIENTQRDVNIAFMNEISEVFRKMGIPTKDVLAAASTKWNFLNFKPGLVGGHCIGVDPYYLIDAAQMVDAKTDLIIMARYLNETVHLAVARAIQQFGSNDVLILGSTFKPNVPDCRNSGVDKLKIELLKKGMNYMVFDPLLHNHDEHLKMTHDCVVYAVDHLQFADLKKNLRSLLSKDGKIVDLTGTLEDADWSL